MTKAAWAAKKKDIQTLQKGITRRRYVYRIKMAAYQKDFHDQYKRPGFGARFLAFLFRLVPKIGPLRAFAFKVPPPAAEKMFLASLDDTIRRYKELLANVGTGQLQLPNQNFDTGKLTHIGDYHLADETYAKLVERLNHDKVQMSTPLQANIDAFYGR